jgi:hypothetical protein
LLLVFALVVNWVLWLVFAIVVKFLAKPKGQFLSFTDLYG